MKSRNLTIFGWDLYYLVILTPFSMSQLLISIAQHIYPSLLECVPSQEEFFLKSSLQLDLNLNHFDLVQVLPYKLYQTIPFQALYPNIPYIQSDPYC